MAVTKNTPINSTLKKAIRYIYNPEKTDGRCLSTHTAARPKLQKVKNKEGFTRKFQRELILYEAAERNLKGKNPPPLETLIKDNGDLSERKAKLYEEYKKLKSKSAEIEVIRSNVDTLLNRPRERNPEIEK